MTDPDQPGAAGRRAACRLLLVLGLTASMTVACAPKPRVAAAGQPQADIEGPSGLVEMVSAHGVVRSVTPATGRIVIDQAAVAERSWPAYTVEYAADPAALAGLRAGQPIRFERQTGSGGGYLTVITAGQG